eukprot:963528-Rhodomonas_salina.5
MPVVASFCPVKLVLGLAEHLDLLTWFCRTKRIAPCKGAFLWTPGARVPGQVHVYPVPGYPGTAGRRMS